jgi:moderate conductance mechanosensitive channel
VLNAQQRTLDAGGEPAEEVRKRASTLEAILNRIIKLILLALLVMLVLSVFDLWPMLTGLGLVAAALTLAGQAIILDYLMGILILAEGQYFNGDWISVDGPNGPLDGEVEEIGLRRTVLRNAQGVVHSVSNGLIRSPSNMTRVCSMATTEITILRGADLEKAIEISNRVGAELAADPAWMKRIIEPPQYLSVLSLTLDGATMRVRGRVVPGAQWQVASELRRRLTSALHEAGVEIDRWDRAAAALSMAGSSGASDDQPA